MSGQKLLADLGTLGWKPGLSKESYDYISEAGFRGENRIKAAMICDVAARFEPITLRGLFYQCVSAGIYDSTDEKNYQSIKRLTGQLRTKGILPFRWLVDSMRSTDKPSSWSGLSDFAETARNAYRKDFWAHLDWYVHIISEKDAIAGTLRPVTHEYDVGLTPIRGNVSHSMAHELGKQFGEIKKPIFVGYLGDFDPNGMDIERDLRAKLEGHSGRQIYAVEKDESALESWAGSSLQPELIHWQRLAVDEQDIDDFSLIPLKPKRSDSRYKKFVDEHGTQAVEVDALPPDELRRRVRESIEQFIPAEEWEKLKDVESLEKETFKSALAGLGGAS